MFKSFSDAGRLFPALAERAMAHRHGGTALFAGVFVVIGFVTRLGLAVFSYDGIRYDHTLAAAFLVGFLFDLAMAVFFAAPLAALLTVTPRRVFSSRVFRLFMHAVFCAATAVFLFTAVSEFLFWEEFGVRFNFIAVDYLVYTTEVVKNIRESYNMPLIFGALALATAATWFGVVRSGLFAAWMDSEEAARGRGRFVGFGVVFAPLVAAFALIAARGSQDTAGKAGSGAVETISAGLRHMGEVQPSFKNAFNTELARNGAYAFVSAFWGNELDYDGFYPVRDTDAVFRRVRGMLRQDNTAFVSDDAHPRDITRIVRAAGAERRLNVIQITVESLSAEFLGCYGSPLYSPMNLTPNLDRLAMGSVWFRRMYATGTRTVRGMEALSLCVPPTPGQAILRRPGSENLATVGSVFANRGYDCAFIYGGDGLFDNMNHFFGNNGYRVVDRPARLRERPGEKFTFENAWGVCDEDLFSWVMDEADRAHEAKRPFHHFVMTTSNHRPYTWPAGRISSGLVGREGGVAYTDYAIGNFLKKAATKPWFKDTVFIVVADHCASVAGKRELEVRKYEIPAFVYSPGNIDPREVNTMCSQIDLAPTLFGLLDFTYVSRFFGRDVLRPEVGPARAFVSNYQKIGLLEFGKLAVLKPVAVASGYACDEKTGDLSKSDGSEGPIEDAVAWYQTASRLFKNRGMSVVSPTEEHEILGRDKS